ncbi:hypothetical protein [Cupriavidus sp. UYPR2.512]|uniref:hypothetical protein n=1 Tax=Cupriavidus sp. UYPR2.512 TaxID=1080187 RepID=UPI00036D058C|nr:hypothetical protein [Cupriavidus sp. UYPR2.512]UIF86109.1 hypothetical protein KAF44_19160 [Cupriavidus necator]
MLRLTVELFPGGRESGRRTLATANIARERSGALADYSIGMNEDLLDDVYTGELKDYPRWSGSIWDLVARAIAVALTGEEALPKRPAVPDVPIHRSGVPGAAYVRLCEIPEPARTFFVNHIRYETRPIVSEVPDPLDCAHLWEWESFLNGGR